MSDDEEKALFCVRYTFDIQATEEGYVVHRSAGAADGAAEDTFVVASIDDYEPLNEAAEKMKHNALLGAGWRPSPKGGAGPGVRAHELLAAGHNAFEVVMKGLAKLTKRCGISLIIDQHSPLYERKCILKTEYRSGPTSSFFYLVDDGGKAGELPLSRGDKNTLLDALRALKKSGDYDVDLDDILARLEAA